MPIPEDIQMKLPWKALADEKQRANLLSVRLKDDLSPAHRLHGVRVRAVACRVDRDDVLFEVEGGDEPLAVVHMTWQKKTDSRWPRTRFFQSWKEWLCDEMLPSHEEYSIGSEET
jgi:hypothetical protein